MRDAPLGVCVICTRNRDQRLVEIPRFPAGSIRVAVRSASVGGVTGGGASRGVERFGFFGIGSSSERLDEVIAGGAVEEPTRSAAFMRRRLAREVDSMRPTQPLELRRGEGHVYRRD